MSRALWSGVIQFGLVACPVKMHKACDDKSSSSFNLFNSKTGNPIRQPRVDEVTKKPVDPDDVIRGVTYDKGRYITVTDAELESLLPEMTKAVSIDTFCKAEDVDPLYIDRAYYLSPDGADAAYALLSAALKRGQKVGIGTVVLRERQHLCMVRALPEGGLALHLLRWHAQLRSTEKIMEAAQTEVDPKALELACSYIDNQTAHFYPHRYHDEYSELVAQLVEAKITAARAGQEEQVQPAAVYTPSATAAEELIAALRATVERQQTTTDRDYNGDRKAGGNQFERPSGQRPT